MEAVNGALIQETVLEQREFFSTGETKSLSFRIEHLKRLKSIIRKYEKEYWKLCGRICTSRRKKPTLQKSAL